MQPTFDARLRRAVALIVVAEWLGTSLWFAPNGAADGLAASLKLDDADFGWLVAATQLGFIAGTFAFAVSGAADRFHASRVFAASCVIGAIANAATALAGAGDAASVGSSAVRGFAALGYPAVWLLRFAVGLTLAGIYPLGMKMIVQWTGSRPAFALGWLVGMLTLGTAMPHALRASGAAWPWQAVVVAASLLALAGATVVAWLGDGPHAPASAAARAPSLREARQVFAVPGFRASALGYFGHMWELYAFWSVLPALCRPLVERGAAPSVPWLAFAFIALGALGCIGGGALARRIGSAPVAAAALAGSAAMCLLYPLIPPNATTWQLAALAVWGLCVVADSPQFSAMSAQNAPPQWLGSALVAQNGIGFAITVASILLMSVALPAWGTPALWLLAPGPLLGLIAMRPLLRRA